MGTLTRAAEPAAEFRLLVYGRALHPDQMELKARRVVDRTTYGLEAWVLAGGHALRFRHGDQCMTELLRGPGASIPTLESLAAASTRADRDGETHVDCGKVRHISTIASEQLEEHVYRDVYAEIEALAAENKALRSPPIGRGARTGLGIAPSLCAIDIQPLAGEVHVQTYHLIGRTRTVVRSQTIFEHD